MNFALALLLANSLRSSPLRIDPMLNIGAQARAEQLCSSGTFSHALMKKAFNGTDYDFEGENLAKGYPDLATTFAAWEASPEHYENLTDANYQFTGFGEACGITVEEFGGYAKKIPQSTLNSAIAAALKLTSRK
jgi:hypothetical protein